MKLVTTAAMSMIMLAAPAAAVDQPRQTSSKSAPAAKADKRLYCIEYEKMTGSHISASACKSKSDWAAEGVDVDKLLKK
jgi:hypothetical protein